MITITNSYPENLSKKDLYRLTRAASTMAKDLDDREELTPVSFCQYTEEKPDPKTGELKAVEILAINTEERGVVSTVSDTFMRDFYDLWNMMDGEKFTFHTVHGMSKAGREFVTCTLAN